MRTSERSLCATTACWSVAWIGTAEVVTQIALRSRKPLAAWIDELPARYVNRMAAARSERQGDAVLVGAYVRVRGSAEGLYHLLHSEFRILMLPDPHHSPAGGRKRCIVAKIASLVPVNFWSPVKLESVPRSVCDNSIVRHNTKTRGATR